MKRYCFNVGRVKLNHYFVFGIIKLIPIFLKKLMGKFEQKDLKVKEGQCIIKLRSKIVKVKTKRLDILNIKEKVK